MRGTADTNILVRAVLCDDIQQAEAAARLLQDADLIAVSYAACASSFGCCAGVYGLGQQDIHAALRALLNAGNVAVNRPAVDAGLAVLDAGGDLADGVIAFAGQWLGGETFVSFNNAA